MSTKYPGGLITKNPVTPAGPYQTGAAPGVWTVEQALQYTKQGIWPIAGNSPPYIEDVFSTWLYTGTGAAQTITNGINLSGNGGLVWVKSRAGASGTSDHILVDTARGISSGLKSNTTGAASGSGGFTAFNANGFSFDSAFGIRNDASTTYVSWTFREQPKFFDIVTWTNTGSSDASISHQLGSAPGVIIARTVNDVSNWVVYHKDLGINKALLLNTTNAQLSIPGEWGSVAPTSTTFNINEAAFSGVGTTMIAYLFAHNAGGFGLTGTDNVITCGSFTTDSSGNASVTLGYEPQWLMTKTATTASSGSWYMQDNMRGWVANNPGSNDNKILYANTSGAEGGGGWASLNATGFTFASGGYAPWANQTFIYIAIRRGPMKVPTSGTSVFGITTAVGTSPMYQSSFPVDVALRKQITGGDPTLQSRLTGATNMFTDYNFAEGSDANVTWYYQNGMFTSTGANANQYGYLIRRAPSYMDVVCYTGDSTTPRNITHNLGAAPELMIVKCRSNARGWAVYSSGIGAGKYLILNATNASLTDTTIWANTAPTSSVFTVGNPFDVNNSGYTYIAYLFATCAGVSKVGSYTGTGALQTINCGFTGGARFVLIKRTDSTGDWYVYDTSNGMTSGNDPYWLINDAAAQVTGTNYVDTDSTGFKVTAAAPAGLNASGGTYLFLAIA